MEFNNSVKNFETKKKSRDVEMFETKDINFKSVSS